MIYQNILKSLILSVFIIKAPLSIIFGQSIPENLSLKEQNEIHLLAKKLKIKTCTIFETEDLKQKKEDLCLKARYDYDKEGKLIQVMNYSIREDTTYYSFDYNQAGAVIKMTYSISDGPITYDYDEKGLLLQESFKGAEIRKYKFIYDNKNCLIKKIGYSVYNFSDSVPKWEIIDEYEFKYDSKNKLTSEVFKYNGEINYIKQYQYDKQGRLKMKIFSCDKKIFNKEEFFYNKKGLIEKDVITSEEEKSITYCFYTYDFY
jgi:hypothetical protein